MPTDLTKTTTNAHDMRSLVMQRYLCSVKDARTLSGMQIFTQLFIASTLYLFPRCASASWWAVLLSFLPAALLYAIAMIALKKADKTKRLDLLNDAFGKFRLPAVILLLLLIFIDMQICMMAICELCVVFLLPDTSRAVLAPVIALFVLLSVYGEGKSGIPRLLHFLRYVLLLALAYCLVTALPHGKLGHLFPWAGQGVGHTLLCSLWLSGSVWRVILPLFLPQSKEANTELQKRKGFLPHPLSFILITLSILCFCYMNPTYAITDPVLSWGQRMTLAVQLNPSSLSWSLMIMSLMLLFLSAISGSVIQTDMFARTLCASPFNKYIAHCFILLTVPLAIWNDQKIYEVFFMIAPYRYAAAFVVTALAAVLMPKKEKRITA